MRQPVAEGFYPSDKETLKKTLSYLFSKAKAARCDSVIGAIVPHAGYAYSGVTAASVYASLPETYEIVVILGTNHSGDGADIAVSFDEWRTPLGSVKNDTETGEKIIRLSGCAVHDELAHTYEHSIEVQIPFLQTKLKKLKIAPVTVSGSLSPEMYAKLAGAVKEAIRDKSALVIASSDFTHYGHAYGFMPDCEDANAWVHETDRKIIDAILERNAKKFIGLAEKSTVCGPGAIATLTNIAGKEGKEGKLVDYRTSCDVSGDRSAIVGYAGILF